MNRRKIFSYHIWTETLPTKRGWVFGDKKMTICLFGVIFNITIKKADNHSEYLQNY